MALRSQARACLEALSTPRGRGLVAARGFSPGGRTRAPCAAIRDGGVHARGYQFPAYASQMRDRTRAAIDRRLEGMGVARARRRWPVLRLVPAGWVRPLIKPTVVRLRVSLLRAALVLVLTAGSILTLLILVR
jgi:hypothetical protein